MKWYQAKIIEDINKPFISKLKLQGKSICLVVFEGEIFALSAKCPHAGGDLSTGWCENGKLVCPLHRYKFDLHTGKGDPGQNDFIETYPVQVRDKQIYVGINSFWEKIRQLYKQ